MGKWIVLGLCAAWIVFGYWMLWMGSRL
jgi:hypothetical protein